MDCVARVAVRRFKIFLLFCFLSLSGAAQAGVSWQQLYDGGKTDVGGPVLQTSDGGYLLVSRTGSFDGSLDPWIFKVDPLGRVQWQTLLPGVGLTNLASITLSADGGCFVASHSLVLKLDNMGRIVWQKRYLFDGIGYDPSTIIATTDGGIAIAATSDLSTNYSSKKRLLVFKLDEAGEVEWRKLYITPGQMLSSGNIIQLREGGYLVTARDYGNGVAHNVALFKLSPQGDIQWQKAYGGPYFNIVYSALETPEGDILLAGTNPQPYPVWEYPWIMKLNADGEILWQRQYDDLAEVRYHVQLHEDHQGGYVLAGTETGLHPFSLRIDSSGAVRSLTNIIGGRRGRLEVFQPTTDGGFILSMYVDHYYRHSGDMLIAKVDSDFTTCGGHPTSFYTGSSENGFAVGSPGLIQNTPSVSVAPTAFSTTATNLVPSYVCLSAIPALDIVAPGTSVNFGQVEVHGEGKERILLLNAGGADLSLTNFSLEGGDGSEFGFTHNCGNLAPGETCSIEAWFSPSVVGEKKVRIAFTTNDPENPSAAVILTGEGVDTTPPVITLLGPEELTIEAGTSYFDPGAKAFDLVDGDLTPAIRAENLVNIHVPSTYVVTYNVNDNAGNRATERTRTVHVIDTTPPVLSLSLDRKELWPPNHKMVPIKVQGLAEDLGSGVAEVRFEIVDEYGALSSKMAGIPESISLEAWRNGKDSDGRLYSLRLIAVDGAGNESITIAEILVPHDQRP